VTAKPLAKVRLTQHAIDALGEIFDYSVSQWGRTTADRYLGELEAALDRIRRQPDLLRPETDLHPALGFYRVNKHLIVCDVQIPSIVVLTVIHASRDIPQRLAELQPTLATEVDLLHQSVRGNRD